MENKRITTKYKNFTYVNCDEGTQCAVYMKEFTENKARVNRLLAVRDIENEILDDFLIENGLKISQLCLTLFYRDSALSSELLTAYELSFKKVKLDFLNKKDFTFKYKKKYENLDFTKIFQEQKTKTRNMKLRTLIDFEVRKYHTQKGYTSFQEYIKSLFDDIGMYPEGMFEEIKKRMSVQKKRVEDFNEVNEKRKVEYEMYSASFTVSKYEKEKLIIPFIEYLKQRGLTISKLVRYELMENRFIQYSDLHLDDEDIAKIRKLKYVAPKVETHIDKMEEKINKKERETIVCLIPDRADLREQMKGQFGTFVKLFVFKKYGMYPEIRTKDTSRLFINKKKSRDIKRTIEELSGGRL